VILFDLCLQLIKSVLLHFCSTFSRHRSKSGIATGWIFISHPPLDFLMLSNNNQTSLHWHVERTYQWNGLTDPKETVHLWLFAEQKWSRRRLGVNRGKQNRGAPLHQNLSTFLKTAVFQSVAAGRKEVLTLGQNWWILMTRFSADHGTCHVFKLRGQLTAQSLGGVLNSYPVGPSRGIFWSKQIKIQTLPGNKPFCTSSCFIS
jgi:hypothetical protein